MLLVFECWDHMNSRDRLPIVALLQFDWLFTDRESGARCGDNHVPRWVVRKVHDPRQIVGGWVHPGEVPSTRRSSYEHKGIPHTTPWVLEPGIFLCLILQIVRLA